MDNCHFCKRTFGLLEVRYKVKEAIKPKGSPNRWKTIGLCYEECSNKNSLNIVTKT